MDWLLINKDQAVPYSLFFCNFKITEIQLFNKLYKII